MQEAVNQDAPPAHQILAELLNGLCRATTLDEVNVAAGIALQDFQGEWAGCPAGCQCEPCVAYLDSPEHLAASA